MEQITVFWVGVIKMLFMLSLLIYIAAGFIQCTWPGIIIVLIASELNCRTLQ